MFSGYSTFKKVQGCYKNCHGRTELRMAKDFQKQKPDENFLVMQPEEQKNQRKNRRKKQEMPREKIPKEQDRNEEGDNYAKFHLLLDDAGPHSTCRKRFRNRRLMELDFSSFKI